MTRARQNKPEKPSETPDQARERRRRELEEELTVVPVGRGRPPIRPTRAMIEKLRKHLVLVGTTNATAAARIGVSITTFQDWLAAGRLALRQQQLGRLIQAGAELPPEEAGGGPQRRRVRIPSNVFADFVVAIEATKETRRLRAEQQLAAHFPKHPSALQWWMERTYRERFRPPKVDLILSKETQAAGAALLEEFRDEPTVQERILRALAREMGTGGAESPAPGPGGDDGSEGG